MINKNGVVQGMHRSQNGEDDNQNYTDENKLSTSSKQAKQDEGENNEFDKFKVNLTLAPTTQVGTKVSKDKVNQIESTPKEDDEQKRKAEEIQNERRQQYEMLSSSSLKFNVSLRSFDSSSEDLDDEEESKVNNSGLAKPILKIKNEVRRNTQFSKIGGSFNH